MSAPRLRLLRTTDEAWTPAANSAGPDSWDGDENLLPAALRRVVEGVMRATGHEDDAEFCIEGEEHLPALGITPDCLCFVAAAVLGALVRDEDDGASLRLQAKLRSVQGSLRICLLFNGVPPLAVVRALTAAGEDAGHQDPTVRHCRRLLAEQGGVVSLCHEGSRVGVEMRVPLRPRDDRMQMFPVEYLRAA